MKGSFLSNPNSRNSVLKRNIIGLCINEGDYSLGDLSKELNTSIPTITKLVGELMEEGFLEDMGKVDTNGGRRPNIYGLNSSAGYFVGTEIRQHHISLAVTDFKGKLISFQPDIPFVLSNSGLEKESNIFQYFGAKYFSKDFGENNKLISVRSTNS